ncbi:Heme oxygenase 1 [Dissostichus eleginoides]|uniref:Heme oxygenase 1 n=1 Tax=Dissostichus eleginoides TaxID=100907 RepID=A0AAD9EWG7_DISEL|nr:Heme oxygenase 1 [Dissostichus eleginoides]
MAGVDDTMRAAVPSWCGGLELEMIYRRTNYIHEMSCGEVGPLLYSRMCCAGRLDLPHNSPGLSFLTLAQFFPDLSNSHTIIPAP